MWQKAWAQAACQAVDVCAQFCSLACSTQAGLEAHLAQHSAAVGLVVVDAAVQGGREGESVLFTNLVALNPWPCTSRGDLCTAGMGRRLRPAQRPMPQAMHSTMTQASRLTRRRRGARRGCGACSPCRSGRAAATKDECNSGEINATADVFKTKATVQLPCLVLPRPALLSPKQHERLSKSQAHQQAARLLVGAEDGGRAGHLDNLELAPLGICSSACAE